MIFAYFTLAVALLIEVVGAYYSITGLAAIFSGAVVPILIMGGSLELGKVTAAVWLKSNWERAGIQYKLYLLPAVAMLMLITSMGIFGYLSKAHNDQNLVSGDVQSKISIYDEKIKTAKENIDADRKQLKQMDEAVDQVMARSTSEEGATKANAIRKSQQRDRGALAKDIETNQKLIAQLNDEAAPIRAEVRKVEAEVGPIKYIAKLIYDDNPDANILEKAVTWVIMIIVAVFDPLALVLILAAQQSLRWAEGEKDEEENVVPVLVTEDEPVVEIPPPPPAPDYEEDDGPLTEEQLAQINTMLEEAKVIPDPDLDIPVLENEEMWAQRVIDENTTPEEEVTIIVPEEPTIEEVVEEPILDTVADYVSPNAPELDASIERPGDYLPPRVLEAAPGKNRGVMNSAIADNALEDTVTSSHADFGDSFPASPNKGDTYLRVDTLPNRLFKFNGIKWIEIDKNSTDSYAYNEEYIKHLIEQIDSGNYDLDLLTDVEREQIQQYLDSK